MSTQKPVHRCRNFIRALFVTDKTWKQPKCLAVSGRINCGISKQSMEYYSVLKREEREHRQTMVRHGVN